MTIDEARRLAAGIAWAWMCRAVDGLPVGEDDPLRAAAGELAAELGARILATSSPRPTSVLTVPKDDAIHVHETWTWAGWSAVHCGRCGHRRFDCDCTASDEEASP